MKSPDRPAKAIPAHFYSLDALRGLAALAVVIYHWQHFACLTNPPSYEPDRQPFFVLFGILYAYGWRAVDLFFCLSGFIFYWLYFQKISNKETSPGEFFILRFSRLYPLHFATLIFVAVAQQYMLWRHGFFFVYSDNDSRHFFLQLLFASDWMPMGNGFNGPVWSVSIEVLLYVLFFLACILRIGRWWQLALLVLGGHLLTNSAVNVSLGRGMSGFFLGGISFHIFTWALRQKLSYLALQLLATLTLVLWIVVPMSMHHNIFYDAYSQVFGGAFTIMGKNVAAAIILKLPTLCFDLFLLPATIVVLALWETQRGTLGRRFAFLGQISYSSYMLHFPLQLVFAGVALSFSIPRTFFYTPLSMLLFFGALLPLSFGCYHLFERPCQSWIRERAFRRWPHRAK